MCDLHKHARLGGSGGMLPQEIFKIQCSEIASEAILGQKRAIVATLPTGLISYNVLLVR